ncbi:protein Niban 2b [Tachysurus ichikawai]
MIQCAYSTTNRGGPRTAEVLGEFGRLYEQQYVVALFNKVRYDVEGGGGPQPQLLHRKVTAPASINSSF